MWIFLSEILNRTTWRNLNRLLQIITCTKFVGINPTYPTALSKITFPNANSQPLIRSNISSTIPSPTGTKYTKLRVRYIVFLILIINISTPKRTLLKYRHTYIILKITMFLTSLSVRTRITIKFGRKCPTKLTIVDLTNSHTSQLSIQTSPITIPSAA